MRSVPALTIAFAALWGWFAVAAAPESAAQDDSKAPGAGPPAVGNCIRVRQIRNTKVIDDSSVILEMTGGRTLLMRLKYPCPQLAFHDYFSYEAPLGLLCAEIDQIVSRAGAHCQIGGFEIYVPPADETGNGGGSSAAGGRPSADIPA